MLLTLNRLLKRFHQISNPRLFILYCGEYICFVWKRVVVFSAACALIKSMNMKWFERVAAPVKKTDSYTHTHTMPAAHFFVASFWVRRAAPFHIKIRKHMRWMCKCCVIHAIIKMLPKIYRKCSGKYAIGPQRIFAFSNHSVAILFQPLCKCNRCETFSFPFSRSCSFPLTLAAFRWPPLNICMSPGLSHSPPYYTIILAMGEKYVKFSTSFTLHIIPNIYTHL